MKFTGLLVDGYETFALSSPPRDAVSKAQTFLAEGELEGAKQMFELTARTSTFRTQSYVAWVF